MCFFTWTSLGFGAGAAVILVVVVADPPASCSVRPQIRQRLAFSGLDVVVEASAEGSVGWPGPSRNRWDPLPALLRCPTTLKVRCPSLVLGSRCNWPSWLVRVGLEAWLPRNRSRYRLKKSWGQRMSHCSVCFAERVESELLNFRSTICPKILSELSRILDLWCSEWVRQWPERIVRKFLINNRIHWKRSFWWLLAASLIQILVTLCYDSILYKTSYTSVVSLWTRSITCTFKSM